MVQILTRIGLATKHLAFRPGVYRPMSFCSRRLKSTGFNYPVKNVEICALKNFYSERPEGLKFNVEYCDTKDYVQKKDAPVVLAVHGSPGSHEDYLPYVERLSKAFDIRFVVPNQPPFETIDRYPMYIQAVEEKAIYLNDFLKKIEVNNVDMVLVHSGGVFPPLYLWHALHNMPDNRLKQVKSFVFFNPAGPRTIKAMRPTWFTNSLAKICRTAYGRKFLRSNAAKRIMQLIGAPVKLDNIDNMLSSIMTMKHSKQHLLDDQLRAIDDQKLPVFFLFSEDDRLIEKEIFYECLERLNVDKKDVVRYNADIELVQQGGLSKTKRAIVFEKGGHYCFLKHHQIVGNYLEEFFRENLLRKSLETSRTSES